MANLYGVANPGALPQFVFNNATVPCPAGVETTVMSAVLAANSGGFFFPFVVGAMAMTMGASVPTAVVIAGRIGGGSDFQGVGIAPQTFVASGTVLVPFALTGVPSQTAWAQPGSTLNITVAPTVNAVTCPINVCFAQVFLFRAPDQ